MTLSEEWVACDIIKLLANHKAWNDCTHELVKKDMPSFEIKMSRIKLFGTQELTYKS